MTYQETSQEYYERKIKNKPKSIRSRISDLHIARLRELGYQAWRIHLCRYTLTRFVLMCCNKMSPENPWLSYMCLHVEHRHNYRRGLKILHQYKRPFAFQIMFRFFWNILSSEQKELAIKKAKAYISEHPSETPRERGVLAEMREIAKKEHAEMLTRLPASTSQGLENQLLTSSD